MVLMNKPKSAHSSGMQSNIDGHTIADPRMRGAGGPRPAAPPRPPAAPPRPPAATPRAAIPTPRPAAVTPSPALTGTGLSASSHTPMSHPAAGPGHLPEV